MNRLCSCVWLAAALAVEGTVDIHSAEVPIGVIPSFAATARPRQSNDVGATVSPDVEATTGERLTADNPLALPGAKVLIPYPELKALLEKAAAEQAWKKEVPPVEAALLSARFRLALGGGAPALEARFEVAAFGEGWRLVPLVGSDVAPASIEPPDVDVVARDGILCALIHGPGRASVTVRFDVLGSRKDLGQPFLKLRTQATTSSTLQVTGLGKGERLRVVGLPEADARAESMPLPTAGAPLEFVLDEDRPSAPSQWEATAGVLVERDDVFLRYTARILADVVEGSGVEMVLELPADTREREIESPGMSRFWVQRDSGGRDVLKIAWADPNVRSREVLLRWRTPPRGDAERWPMECPRPQGARSFDALFVAARPELMALEVQPPSASTASTGLAGWIREKLGAREYVVATAGASLAPRWLKTADTERATVKSAKCATTLVGDGSALGQGEFEIEHAGPMRWRVRLPEGSRLLKCAAGGASAQPILSEGGELEFPLPASSKGVSTVSLSYTEKKDTMDPVGGHMSLCLPSTPLFAERIEWQLLLPQAYEVTAVDGNLDVGKGSGPALVLEKRLCRGEMPKVDLHYRKKGPRE
ncbi:MAG TPA: hypothetical protein PLU30_19830 [Verrucomicrobiae bacterium]|nr:hypothetical protein [Verrucomicrobiae bacterium]